MTNEEKAREYQSFIESNNPSAEAYGFYNAYLSACEWKDKQFKEYLENTIKAYKCRGEKFFADEIKVLENIINELFKEEQK